MQILPNGTGRPGHVLMSHGKNGVAAQSPITTIRVTHNIGVISLRHWEKNLMATRLSNLSISHMAEIGARWVAMQRTKQLESWLTFITRPFLPPHLFL